MNILEQMEQTRLERVTAEQERARTVELESAKLPFEVKKLVDNYFVWPASPEPFSTCLTNKENLVNYLFEIQGQDPNDKTEKQDSKFINEVWYQDKLNGPGKFPKNAINAMRQAKKSEPKKQRFYIENLELF